MGKVAPVQSKTLLDPLTVGSDIPWCYLNDLFNALYYSAGNIALGQTVNVVSDYANIFGYNRGDVNFKLISYLNYGNIVNPSSNNVGTTSNRWFNTSRKINNK